MSEGLTFRFVFQDDGGAAPPVEASPGAAERARPTTQHDEPPAPRSAPEFSPRQPERPEPAPRPVVDERDSPRAPAGRPERRSAPRSAGEGEPAQKKSPKQPVGAADENEKRESGLAQRLISEMVSHLRALPGIGQSIGRAFAIIEPLIVAQRRNAELNRQRRPDQPQPAPRRAESKRVAEQPAPLPTPERKQQPAPPSESRPATREPAQPQPRPVSESREVIQAELVNPDDRFPVKPFELPAPRPVKALERTIERRVVERVNPDKQFPVKPFAPPERKPATVVVDRPVPRPKSESLPTPTPAPERREKKEAAPVLLNNPGAGAATAALERLITELGPLPAGQRELNATLRPLTSLGYTLTELRDAVRGMRERAKPEQPPAAPSSAPQPRKSGIPNAGQQFQTVRPVRPQSPTASTPPPSPRPAPLPTAPSPSPVAGAASAAASTAAAAGEAETGAATAAVGVGALGGPVGIAIGVGLVATAGAASRALETLASAARKVDSTFTNLSERLAPYNGRLALAQAQVRMQQTMLDIERSGRLGGDLAKFTEERARIGRELQRIATTLEEMILPAINASLGGVAETIEDSTKNVSVGIEIMTNILRGMSINEAVMAAAAKAGQNAREREEQERRAKEALNLAGVFWGSQPNLQIGGVNFGNATNWGKVLPQVQRQNRPQGRAFKGF